MRSPWPAPTTAGALWCGTDGAGGDWQDRGVLRPPRTSQLLSSQPGNWEVNKKNSRVLVALALSPASPSPWGGGTLLSAGLVWAGGAAGTGRTLPGHLAPTGANLKQKEEKPGLTSNYYGFPSARRRAACPGTLPRAAPVAQPTDPRRARDSSRARRRWGPVWCGRGPAAFGKGLVRGAGLGRGWWQRLVSRRGGRAWRTRPW